MAELEGILEKKLIEQLTQGTSQWTYRPDLKTEDDLWANVRTILENGNKDKLDDKPLTDQEFEQVKNQLSFATFYDAARWIAGENGVAHVSVQRDTTTVQLTALKRDDIAGGSSVYEVINQYRAMKEDEADVHEQDRRFDISLLINGIPLIHFELKNRDHSYMDAFRQIRKYIREGKFTGIFSAVQMFVISNGVDTKYFAAAQEDELNEKFLTGWTDADNQPVNDYLKFAEQVLKIPEAHQMVMKYAVLDKNAQRILLLRSYQIHAIEAIREASKRGESGFIWHTTGSGKTMTSYKAARNLLIDIPSIEKTIFLIDRKDLDMQTTLAFQSYANNDVIEVDETDNVSDLINKLKNHSQQVIVTTIQKLSRAVKFRLQEGTPACTRIKNLRVAFIVDECHRTVTPATQRMLSEFFAHSLWYGFTGTPRFDVNAYDAQGDLPRTTDELYSNGEYRNTERYQKLLEEKQLPYCLHKYTVREAIRDNAVLGFTTEHLGANHLKEDDSNEDVAFYDTESHMLSVLDVILNKSREKLGFQNGKGQTYEALLTVRSIKIAQAYYELLKKVKNGETPLTISEETKKVLPDFPKFAITYSVSSDADDESSDVNVPQMKSALDEYNQMFDTSFGIGEIQGYNANLNDRLARKGERYKNRAEQLDLVIVVNRLLTGFDAPCLSTVFIDRQPLHPHDIIQTFSRTNRLYDKRKQSGQIVTFQSPHIFKKAVDDALVLYSAGGEASALAPDWEASLEEFRKCLAYLRLTAETPEVLGICAKPQKLRFLKAFQEFDKAYTNLKAFTHYGEQEPDSYGITQDEYERYAAWYKNIREEFKKAPPENPDTPDDPDMEYELMAYSREKIDYDYIVALIQSVASASGEERRESHYQNLMKEINAYIEDLLRVNPKLGALMRELWSKVQQSPEEFGNTRVSYVLETMRNEAIIRVVSAFASKWCVPESAVMYAAQRIEPDSDAIPGLNNIKESADYAKYVEVNGKMPKFKYNQSVKNALLVMLREEVIPLRFDDYRAENQTAVYEFPSAKGLSYVADDSGKYDT